MMLLVIGSFGWKIGIFQQAYSCKRFILSLNFCPKPGHYNKSILKKKIETLNKKIKLKAFFYNKNEQKQATATNEPSIHSKTKIENPKNHNTVEIFIEAVNKDVVEKISNKLPENNLPTKMVWNIFRNATILL